MTATANYNYAEQRSIPVERNFVPAQRVKTAGRITTVRLPEDTRRNLEFIAKALNKTKTEVIVEAINMYYEKEDNELDSYTLGLPYFGKYDLGYGDLSTTYKQRMREGLIAKHKRQEEEFDKYVEELRKKRAKKRTGKSK